MPPPGFDQHLSLGEAVEDLAIEQLIRTGVPMSVAARAAAHAMFGPLTEPPEGPKG